ncbi:MAG: hypothetical protein JNK82_07415 [Myxococcaceae bacterium]|nr:hypothetical protein [Myxococcaceae bacterium]
MGVWLVLFLAAGGPDEWSTFPGDKPAAAGKSAPAAAPAAPPGPAAKASGATTMPAAATPRYRNAVELISNGRYAEATVVLNQVAAEYPKVPELYAARCSAQLGVKQPGYAEADCAYALKLKPSLSTALFGLASAEEQLGKKELAMRHYREYQKDPGARADLKEQAGKRADALGGADFGSPPAPPPAGERQASPPPKKRSSKPECKMGKNGRQACGYNCEAGTDGVAACADTPDGSCTKGEDGHVTCTQLAVRGGANAGGAVPECRTGTDGVQVCGYNCKKGTNGRYFCATMPDGECTPTESGTYTCP